MTTPRRSARHLIRRWWPVALAVPLGAAAGAGYAVLSHPSYSATAYVLVVPQNPGEVATATNFAQAYGRLAGQPQVLAVAAAETGHTRGELESLVSGTTSPDAPMIEITGTGKRAQEAAQTADAVAGSLVSFANTSSKDTNVRLVTLAPAAEPDKPTSPSGKLDVAVGAAAGVLLGSLVMMTRRRGGAAAEPEAVESVERVERVETAVAPQAPQAAEPAEAPATPRPRSGEQDAEAEPRPRSKRESKAAPKSGAEAVAEPESKAAPEAAAKPSAKEKAAAGSKR
jgi:capsular polysaccharide biosynthesis protein